MNLLDVMDNFVNNFGIVAVALVATVTLSAAFGALPTLRNHINKSSSFKLGRTWQLLVGGIAPVILGYILINELQTVMSEGYGGMPSWFVNTFGWGMSALLIVVSLFASFVPWSKKSAAAQVDSDGDLIPPPILDRLVDGSRVQEAIDDPTIASDDLRPYKKPGE